MAFPTDATSETSHSQVATSQQGVPCASIRRRGSASRGAAQAQASPSPEQDRDEHPSASGRPEQRGHGRGHAGAVDGVRGQRGQPLVGRIEPAIINWRRVHSNSDTG
jgi:hypothetical protein